MKQADKDNKKEQLNENVKAQEDGKPIESQLLDGYKQIDLNNGRYQIDKEGSVYDSINKCYIQIKRNSDGYKVVTLKYNNDLKAKQYRLQQLLGECFIDNPNKYKYIDVQDDDKNNINLDNLFWTNQIIENKKDLIDKLPVGSKALNQYGKHQLENYFVDNDKNLYLQIGKYFKQLTLYEDKNRYKIFNVEGDRISVSKNKL